MNDAVIREDCICAAVLAAFLVGAAPACDLVVSILEVLCG